MIEQTPSQTKIRKKWSPKVSFNPVSHDSREKKSSAQTLWAGPSPDTPFPALPFKGIHPFGSWCARAAGVRQSLLCWSSATSSGTASFQAAASNEDAFSDPYSYYLRLNDFKQTIKSSRTPPPILSCQTAANKRFPKLSNLCNLSSSTEGKKGFSSIVQGIFKLQFHFLLLKERSCPTTASRRISYLWGKERPEQLFIYLFKQFSLNRKKNFLFTI